jgi:AcrR family transcriptional regulator
VLDCAYALFEEKGYTGTTMRELAARAGIAPGTIFAHFPDKPSLVVAAFQEDVGRAVDAAWDTLPDDGLIVRLLHLVRELYRFYARRAALSKALVAQSLFVGAAHEAAMDAMVGSFLSRVASLYAEAAERGELAPREEWLTPALGFWADYFLGLVGGLRQDRFDVDAHVALVEKLLEQRLWGLATGKEGPAPVTQTESGTTGGAP